jgi:hypothetical protein
MANSIKAPIINTVPSRSSAPHASPSLRIRSRLWRAVMKTFSKRSDVAGVKDPGSRKQDSCATHRMSAPLLITGTSSVRDRDVNGRLTRPAHSASASASIVPNYKHGFFATKASLQAQAPFESYRPRLCNYFLAFVCAASVICLLSMSCVLQVHSLSPLRHQRRPVCVSQSLILLVR